MDSRLKRISTSSFNRFKFKRRERPNAHQATYEGTPEHRSESSIAARNSGRADKSVILQAELNDKVKFHTLLPCFFFARCRVRRWQGSIQLTRRAREDIGQRDEMRVWHSQPWSNKNTQQLNRSDWHHFLMTTHLQSCLYQTTTGSTGRWHKLGSQGMHETNQWCGNSMIHHRQSLSVTNRRRNRAEREHTGLVGYNSIGR